MRFALLLAAARNVVPGAARAHANATPGGEMPVFDGNWFGKEVHQTKMSHVATAAPCLLLSRNASARGGVGGG